MHDALAHRTDAEVLVVGGGPAGAATASFLARAGVDVLVLDRARFPRDKPCSEYLSPQASRLLDELGVLEALEQAGPAHLDGMRVYSPEGVTLQGDFVAAHGYHGFRDRGIAIRRTVLDATLLARARTLGARVCEETRVRDLVRDAGGRVTGVVATGADGATRTLTAPLVIGADGLRSVVARRAGLGKHGWWPRRLALVTHYEGVRAMTSWGEMHVFPGDYIGLSRVGRTETNVALVMPARRAPELKGDAAGFLERRLAREADLAARLSGARRTTPVLPVGTFNWRARRACAPGVALVGDAADFFDPFTGEGIYAALRGAELLCSYAFAAVRDRAPRAHAIALAAYDRARRHAFGGKWAVERAIASAVAVPALINHAARALARRKDLADLLVGVTGDFVPAREVLRARYILPLILSGFPPTGAPDAPEPHQPVPHE